MSADHPVIDLKRRRAERLGREITKLFGLITAATCELLMKIAELDRDGLWEGQGLSSCAHWLNWQCGIGMNAAREKVRVARALEKLPKVSEAFRRGEVSYSKVRAITRVGKPENEDYLLMIARHGTAHHVETLVRGYRRATRLNDPEYARRQVESRGFEYHWDEDGSLVFKGRLPAEVGAMLLQAMQASMDRADENVTAETREPVTARRADAMTEMAACYLANGPAESSSAERYQVMVHVTAEGSGVSAGTIEGGPGVTADPRAACGPTGVGAKRQRGSEAAVQTSRRLCCDASISRLIEDDKGQPISIGRKSRVIPPPMRRALQARDRQCRFPGCTHRHFTDGHHIQHWSEGGETGLDNLVLLCHFHHHLVHEGGFGCEKDADNRVLFRDPSGQPIEDTGPLPSPYRGNVLVDLKARLEDRFIDADTVVTRWTGEKMDRDLAVALLCNIDYRTSDTLTPH